MASIPNDLVAMPSAVPSDLQPVKPSIPTDLQPVKQAAEIPHDLQPTQPHMSQEQKLAGYTAEHPVLGNVARFGIAGLRNISEGFTNLEEPFAPETAAQDRANIAQAFPVQGTAGKIGNVGTGVLNSAVSMASKPVGVITGALQGGGQALGQIQDLQNQGVQIPAWKRGLYAGGAAATGAATAMIPGAGKALEGSLLKKGAQYLGQESVNQGVGVGAGLAQNAIQTGYDPNANMTQGLGANAAALALAHGLTHGTQFLGGGQDIHPAHDMAAQTVAKTATQQEQPKQTLHDIRTQQAAKEEGTYIDRERPTLEQKAAQALSNEPEQKSFLSEARQAQIKAEEEAKADEIEKNVPMNLHQVARQKAAEIESQPPKFTEGAFGRDREGNPIKTEPGEIGTVMGRPAPMPEAVDVGKGNEAPQHPSQAQPGSTPPSPSKPQTVIEKGLNHPWVREIGQAIGSDIGLSKNGVRQANNLRELWGKQDLNEQRLQSQLSPHVEYAEHLSENERTSLADSLEKQQPPSDPKANALYQDQKALNIENARKAESLGLDVSGWKPEYLGRLAERPDINGKFPGERGYVKSASLPGTNEGYLKSRKYETYSDFKNAIEDQGWRLKYDNPVKMALAKQIEVRNSLLAHETFQDAIDKGSVRLLSKEDPLRSGEKLIDDPIRWTHDKFQEGTRYAAPNEIADLMNHQHSEGTSSNILNSMIDANRQMTRIKMVMGLRHYVTESLGSAAHLWGQSITDLTRGNLKGAARNAVAAIPGVGGVRTYFKGKAVREGAVAPGGPSLESQAIAAGGGEAGGKENILEPKAWDGIKEEWNNGSKLVAGANAVKHFVSAPTRALFNDYVPNMRRGVLGMIAQSEIENAQKKGLSLSSDEFKDTMAKHVQSVSNLMGVESEKTHFQNKTMAAISKAMFGVPNWVLGKPRLTIDAVRGLGPLFTAGKLEPATATVLGGAVATLATGSALYAAFNNGNMPTSWQDMRHVPTSFKDNQGRPIRFTVPYPWEMMTDLAAGDRTATETLSNRLSPLAQFADEMYKGQDYTGAPTRESWGDISRTLWHTLAQPYGVEAATRQGEPMGAKMAGAVGFNPSAQKFSQGPGERLAHELIQSHTPDTPRSDEQQDQYELKEGLLNHDPKAQAQAKQMIQDGKMSVQDYQKMVKQTKEKPGLAGLLDRNELQPDDVKQIWAKASDQEKGVLKPYIERHAQSYVKKDRAFLQEVMSGK